MNQQASPAWPRPSRMLIVLMAIIGALWVMFAVAMNWGGAPQGLFGLLVGDSAAVRSGQVWRLLTALFMHNPRSPLHPAFVCLMLYFFVPSLEERWGPKRTLGFLFGSGAAAYAVQVGVGAVVPSLDAAQFFGGMAMAEAAAVAWAVGARGQVVRLFFVIPVTPMVMVGLFFAWSVFSLIAQSPDPEGLVTPFGAMAAGYLGADASPLRRWFLRRKLQRLEKEADGLAAARKRRANGPKLRLIKGGKDDDDEPPVLH